MRKPSLGETIIVFDEPNIEFRYDQLLKDPRHGLALFGPYDSDLVARPALTYVLLGTNEGIERFGAWAAGMNSASTYAPKENHELWVPFPGFEASFGIPFPTNSVRTFSIDERTMSEASRRGDPHERAYHVVDLYLDGLRRAQIHDEQIGVAICVVPDEVWKNCRPESQVSDATSRRIPSRQKLQLMAGQRQMFNEYDVNQFWLSTDFRRQLKARSMEYGIPLQLIRESTLAYEEVPGGRRT